MHIADPHVAQAVAVMIRSLQFKLANPCGNLGEEFGVSFVKASGPDQCLSASATVSFKAIAAIAGLDIGALAAKIPAFLGLTQGLGGSSSFPSSVWHSSTGSFRV